jgi:uncharacterized protein DUF2809
MEFGFNLKFVFLSIVLFMVEISIALFSHDRLVRPFVGDMLVVILIFTIFRSFIKTNNLRLALSVLVFSFAVEIGQYFNLISVLGLQGSGLLRTVIGTTFDFHDLLAYGAGISLIVLIEILAKYHGRRLLAKSQNKPFATAKG